MTEVWQGYWPRDLDLLASLHADWMEIVVLASHATERGTSEGSTMP